MFKLENYELLGDVTDDQIKDDVTRLISQHSSANLVPASALATFINSYTAEDQGRAKKELLLQGVSATAIEWALRPSTNADYFNSKWFWVHSALSSISGAACAYHGYKRNNSIGWAIGWFFLGSIFFPLTPVIAVAQGFGKPKKV
jgi:hypothetical protein